MAKAKTTGAQGPNKHAAKQDAEKKSVVLEILYNRKLRHDYAVLDSWEAGIVLMGSEVKSLRTKDVQWGDAHARISGPKQELWLYGMHIGVYLQAGVWGHQADQPRKLLMHRKEIERIASSLVAKGQTLVPERILFRDGKAKIVICLCKGKTHEDKRSDLMKKAQGRDVEREMARRMKRG